MLAGMDVKKPLDNLFFSKYVSCIDGAFSLAITLLATRRNFALAKLNSQTLLKRAKLFYFSSIHLIHDEVQTHKT